MKKLKLSLENLQGGEILSREQLKKVVGGYYDGDGGGSGDAASDCKCASGAKGTKYHCTWDHGACIHEAKGACPSGSSACDEYCVTANSKCWL